MKKILLSSSVFILTIGVFAQGVNPFTPGDGNFNAGSQGSQYSQGIDYVIPTQITVNAADFGSPFPLDITADVTSVTFTLAGLPTGVTPDCNPCTFGPGDAGTITLSGIPTQSGTFTVTIASATSGTATVMGFPVAFGDGQQFPAAPNAMDGGPYTMQVGSTAVQELNVSVFDVIQNIPNPFSGNTTIKFSTPTAGNVDFTVFDMIGKRVYSEKIQAQAKTNSINFSAEKLAPGSYFYSLSNGTKTITKKMIVAGK